MVVGCFICGGGKSFNIGSVYYYTEKWDFIVDNNFLCEIKNGIILKGLLYWVNFISVIIEKGVCRQRTLNKFNGYWWH